MTDGRTGLEQYGGFLKNGGAAPNHPKLDHFSLASNDMPKFTWDHSDGSIHQKSVCLEDTQELHNLVITSFPTG
jgi:hypothetical protein